MPGGRSFVWQGTRLMGKVTRQDEDGQEYVVTASGDIFKGNPREGYRPFVEKDAEAKGVAEGVTETVNNLVSMDGVSDSLKRSGTRGYLQRLGIVLGVIVVVMLVLLVLMNVL